jgi:predicted DNA-binding protein with PD1-like motif
LLVVLQLYLHTLLVLSSVSRSKPMQISAQGQLHIVVLEKGESLITQLTEHVKSIGVDNAVLLSGIGAAEFVSCGYYELPTKTYHFQDYPELCEVTSLAGNLMIKNGEPFWHLHGTFSDAQNNVFGGHVAELVVGVTLEIVFQSLSSSFGRQRDEAIGLDLIVLDT